MLVGVDPFLYCNWLEKDFRSLPWGPLLWEGSYNEPRKFHFQSCAALSLSCPIMLLASQLGIFVSHDLPAPNKRALGRTYWKGGGEGMGSLLIRRFVVTFQLQIKRVLRRTYQTGGGEGVVVRVL